MKKHFHDKCFKDVVTNKTITWVTYLYEPEVDGTWKEFSEVVKLEYPGIDCRVIKSGGLDGLELQIEVNSDAPKKKKAS
jgi:hypothetical protein